MADELEIRPQADNANRHTQRGMAELERSIDRDGWIGAVTVAADGEAFDGSGRVDKWAEAGFPEPIIVHSDGTRPIIHVRDDIPSAQHERAQRLSVAANRVAELNLDWDTEKLMRYADSGLLDSLFTQDELVSLRADLSFDVDELPEPGDGGDEWLSSAHAVPQRVSVGDIWEIGPHILVCGDATDPGSYPSRKAPLLLTDPPYNVGKEYADGIPDNLSVTEYSRFVNAWFPVSWAFTERQIVTPGREMLQLWIGEYSGGMVQMGIWAELNTMTHGTVTRFSVWEPILFYGSGFPRVRSNDLFDYPLSVQRFETGESLSGMHPCPKPLALWMDLIENFTEQSDNVVDNFAGTGTTLIACHRLKRRAHLIELSPTYCDVILARAEAEGIERIRKYEREW